MYVLRKPRSSNPVHLIRAPFLLFGSAIQMGLPSSAHPHNGNLVTGPSLHWRDRFWSSVISVISVVVMLHGVAWADPDHIVLLPILASGTSPRVPRGHGLVFGHRQYLY